jgi:hypothetical protein
MFLFLFVSVTPGSLQLVKAQPPIFEKNQLLPGCVAKEFILEVYMGELLAF